uniref:Uncharacterized protein n=1 Tax=Setaria italica TaxID=4555 RepID=K4AI77_SETIT
MIDISAYRRDSFRVAAWCSPPSIFPLEMELEILEPTMMADNLQPEKRTLVYPVTVSVIAAPDVLPRPGDPPSPPPADGDGRRRGNRTSVHARLGPHPAEIAHVASQDGAAASSGVLRRGGSAPLDIKDPTASALPEGASPPVNPRTMAASGPEREALASASHLADRAQRAAACASPEVVSPPVNPQTTAASGPEREASALASPLVDRAQRAAACASPEGVSPLVSVSRITDAPLIPNENTSFMARLTKNTTRILPTPCTNRIRTRARTPAAPPRRSHRIAGVELEPVGNTASSRNKKKVMRALDIIGETEGIDQHALDEYGKLFTRSSSITASHVQAPAALFGWATPVEEELALEVDT